MDCTWNEGKEKAKQVITFEHRPKTLFQMSDDKILELERLTRELHLEGPPALKKIKEIKKKHPTSLFAHVTYLQALEFFEYKDDAKKEFKKVKQLFPQEPFTFCYEGRYLLEKGDLVGFEKLFSGIEVLKGIFPKRRLFYFEEALAFHHLWAFFFQKIRKQDSFEKHKKVIIFILNTRKSIAESCSV